MICETKRVGQEFFAVPVDGRRREKGECSMQLQWTGGGGRRRSVLCSCRERRKDGEGRVFYAAPVGEGMRGKYSMLLQ